MGRKERDKKRDKIIKNLERINELHRESEKLLNENDTILKELSHREDK